ncbi:MAG TPA: TlpA disulfide reductase family protein [Candidatus Tumulicola sp.]
MRPPSWWSNATTAGRFRFPIAWLWDVIALAAIAFAAWKIFVAPRAFAAADRAQSVPHATFERLDGGELRVADQRGRMMYLDFYASWCTPCKIELPLVEKWAARHPAALVVPIDVAEPRAVAADFARRYRLTNVAVDPRGDARGIFSIAGFPTVVVVDPAGRIRATWEGLNPAIGLALSNAQARLASQR